MIARGVVFDMDGVLFDTERIYDEAWRHGALETGMANIEPAIAASKGLNDESTREMFARDYPEVDYPAFDAAQSRWFERYVAENGLPEKPYLHEILAALRAAGARLAVATSTGRERCLRHLREAGIEGCFDAVITGDSIERGKPAPDIYLKACEALGLPPAECVAVEDSHNGIRSAAAAGMLPAMVVDEMPVTEEMRALSWGIFDDLDALRRALLGA